MPREVNNSGTNSQGNSYTSYSDGAYRYTNSNSGKFYNDNVTRNIDGKNFTYQKNQYLQAAKPLDATSMMAMATDSTNRLINPLAITVFTKILPAKDLTLDLDLATVALKNEKFTWKCFISAKRISTYTNSSRFLCRNYNKFGFMMKNLSNRFFPVSFQIFFSKTKLRNSKGGFVKL